VRLVSQRLAGRRVRSLCWAQLRFRWGEKQNRDDCVYHALRLAQSIFDKGAAACGAPDRDRHVGQPGREHYHWDIPPMRGLRAIHPYAIRSLPNPVW
jgi:hypothetical protein